MLFAAATASVVAAMGFGTGQPAVVPVTANTVSPYAPGTACGAKEGALAPLPPSGQEADAPADPSGQITFATANDVHRWGVWWHDENLRESVTTDHPYLGKPTLRLEVTPGFTAVGSVHMQGLDVGDTVTVRLWYDGQGAATICPFIQQSNTDDLYWPRVHELVLNTHSTPGWRTYQWRIPDMLVEGAGFQIDNTGSADVVLYLGAVTW